jgi:ParB-like nuclease domain
MTTIPLNKLVPARTNVRKSGGKDGIEELAASIAAHGLLTSLAVRKAARGKFTVIAGQRRYHALTMLASRDQIPADLPILCTVVEPDTDATELGLAENVVRLAMHPADSSKRSGPRRQRRPCAGHGRPVRRAEARGLPSATQDEEDTFRLGQLACPAVTPQLHRARRELVNGAASRVSDSLPSRATARIPPPRNDKSPRKAGL